MNSKRIGIFFVYLGLGITFLLKDQFSFRGVLFSETHTRLIGLFLIVVAIIFLFTRPKTKEGRDAEGSGGSEKSND